MELELNNYGFFNLAKPEFTIVDCGKNSFRSRITIEELSKFLSINELFLDGNFVTDGCNIYGSIRYIN